MRNKNDLFNYTLRELEKKGQHELAMYFQRQLFLGQAIQKQEMERMKQEIVEEVLARLSIMFETGTALNEIKSLNNALNSLGNNK